MTPTFFYYPFTCATASHIILEESGLEYHRQLVDLRDGKHRDTDYLQTNPKGSVPALLLEQGLLTENQAILTYVADQVADLQLIPQGGSLARARAHEWMNFCAATLHPYARSVFRPSAYAGENELAQAAVRANGQQMMRKSSALVEAKLSHGSWSATKHFSVSDAYLYVMYLWSRDERMGDMPDCPKWRALAGRVHERDSVQTVTAIELSDRSDYVFPDFSA